MRRKAKRVDKLFFTPLNPGTHETEEEFQGDLSRPSKVHYKTEWKLSQDAVYGIHLAEKGPTFGQTRSHTITF